MYSVRTLEHTKETVPEEQYVLERSGWRGNVEEVEQVASIAVLQDQTVLLALNKGAIAVNDMV